jgi:hypothetical protein
MKLLGGALLCGALGVLVVFLAARFRNSSAERGRNDSSKGPFESPQANRVYDLLFCDDLALIAPQADTRPTDWQATLFADPPNLDDLRSLASDAATEGRVRYFAYLKLRTLRGIEESPGPSEPLGVVLETNMGKGLFVVAAYHGGSVRLIGQPGEMAVVEGVPELEPIARELLARAKTSFGDVPPSSTRSKSPPSAGTTRVTLLGSDGAHVAEGPHDFIRRHPSAAAFFDLASAARPR